MKAYNDTNYPVFEADQVLSQNHLNTIISYLEEQDRLTRTGLIGIGTICGMEVSFPDTTAVKIDCGTAVTSLGFQINWESREFYYYKDIELPGTFLSPNFQKEPSLEPVLKYGKDYVDFKSCRELIYIDPVKLKDPKFKFDDGVVPIPNARFFNDKVIMLLLEVSLIDIKNCVATGCDDKGKRLEFKVRPIIVNSEDALKKFENKYTDNANLEQLFIERFNVPQTNLVNGQQILNAFYGMMNDTVLSRITTAIFELYESFKNKFNDSIDNYSFLANVRPKLDEVVKSYRSTITIQYAWQWLCDIVEAYNEIYDLNETHSLSSCCSSDTPSMFPLHLLLGRIITKTSKLTANGLTTQQPQYLARIYNPNEYNTLDTDQRFVTPLIRIASGTQKEENGIAKSLIERLILILNNFNVSNNYLETKIRITPSQIGNHPLSERAIPYYYNTAVIPQLINVWNPRKTLKKEQSKILSYHSDTYSKYLPTIQPLNYNIDRYNFFKVEGHIGQNFTDVVSKLLQMKSASRLSFNVIAVNAIDIANGNLNINTYTGDWGDIQLSYEIVSRHWEDVIGKCIEWLEANSWVIRYISKQEYVTLINVMKRGRNSTYKLFSQFLPVYSNFIGTYQEIEAIATDYRKRIFRDISEVIQPDPQEEPHTRLPYNVYTEEFIDQLDQIIMVCSKGQFRALYQNATKKWKEGSQIQTLKKFLDEHPGIQSQNGVCPDGTFVLVYQDTTLLNQPRTIATNAVITPQRKVVFSPTIEDYSIKIKAYASLNLQAKTYTDLVDYIDKYVYLTSIKDVSNIPEKVIIADFYLPYLSNISGPGINFIVNPTDPAPTGDADFDKPDFNSPDFLAKEKPVKKSKK